VGISLRLLWTIVTNFAGGLEFNQHMIPIKIHCSCGQKFAFDVEPVNGRMPSAMACPVCGREATQAANEQIRLQLARSTPAAPPKKSNTLMIVGLCIASLALLGGIGGALLWFKSRDTGTSSGQTQSSAPVRSSDPSSRQPSTAANKPAAVQRDPSFIAVGALFDRDLKTRHVEITRVLANSPAKEAGIVAGDILVSIDDEPIQELRLKEIAEMVYGPVDSKITMELISAETGKTNQVEMVRKKFHK
jgi:hypothetical protein